MFHLDERAPSFFFKHADRSEEFYPNSEYSENERRLIAKANEIHLLKVLF